MCVRVRVRVRVCVCVSVLAKRLFQRWKVFMFCGYQFLFFTFRGNKLSRMADFFTFRGNKLSRMAIFFTFRWNKLSRIEGNSRKFIPAKVYSAKVYSAKVYYLKVKNKKAAAFIYSASKSFIFLYFVFVPFYEGGKQSVIKLILATKAQ